MGAAEANREGDLLKYGAGITASPAITGDWLIYRTDSHLYCIGGD